MKFAPLLLSLLPLFVAAAIKDYDEGRPEERDLEMVSFSMITVEYCNTSRWGALTLVYSFSTMLSIPKMPSEYWNQQRTSRKLNQKSATLSK